MRFPITPADGVELRPLAEIDAPTLFETIERNRAHLDPWLRWSGHITSVEDALGLIRRFQQKWVDDDGFHAGLWSHTQLIGGLVCHAINHASRKTEIGYWLTAEAVGRGYVTRAGRAVIDQLFREHRLHRIEIQCATDNVRSRAVAERLGFVFEGVKRESEWLTTRFADHALYALLEQEWQTALP